MQGSKRVSRRPLGAEVAGLVLAALSVLPCEAVASEWWSAGDSACPAGAELRGAPPPYGNDIACVHANGEWHGPRTTWFDACSRKKPCKDVRAQVRFEGEYQRGIEHGWWVWWHKDGKKGLEGSYYAGKKSGRWQAWTRSGEHQVIEHPVLGDTEVVSADLERALQAARETAGKDLTSHLERASKDLRGQRDHGGKALQARSGGASGESLGKSGSAVSTDWLGDAPEVDLGKDHFDGQGEDAPAYVRQAIRRATPQVGRCYQEAAAKNPRLKGSLTARFLIMPDGRTSDVRVVTSQLTGTVNRCVKTALGNLRFSKPPHGQPVEVLSPWSFEAG